MAITRYAGDRFTIGAGETKPTGVLDGAVLIDTGNLTQHVKRTVAGTSQWSQIAGGGGGGSPGGTNTQVQFNNTGAFGGDADLTFTDGNRLNVNKLGISGNIYDSNNSIGDNGMVLTNEGTTGVNWKAIEDVLSGVGGSGVANYVARWADEDTLTTGVLVDNGTNVGINVPSPNFPLEISSSSNATVRIEDTTNNSRLDLRAEDSAVLIRSTSNFPMRFDVNQTERMRIDTAGNVGIGTNDPLAKLVVKAAIPTVYAEVTPSISSALISIANLQASETTNDQAQLQFNVTGGSYNRVGSIGLIAESASNRKGALVFTTDDAGTRTEKMRIAGDGNVGIGITSPNAKLHIAGSGGDVKFTIDRTDARTYSIYTESNSSLSIKDEDASADRLTILSDGNVGIGTAVPSQKLHVQGNLRVTGAYYASDNNAGSSNQVLTSTGSGGTDWKSLSQIGGVTGSGTSNKLPLWDGTSSLTDSIITQSSTSYVTVFGGFRVSGNHTDTGSQLNLWCDSSGHGKLAVYDMQFLTGSNSARNNTALFLKTDGNVGIGTVAPSQKLHVQGTLRLTGAFYDSNNAAGTSGQVLTSTGSATDWKDLDEISGVTASNPTTTNYVTKWSDGTNEVITDSLIYDDGTSVGIGTSTLSEALTVNGRVEAEEFIGDLRGAVVFKANAGENISKGQAVYISGISGNKTVVSLADANDASKMPAFGVAAKTASASSDITIVTFGRIDNLDTSSYTEGDELFVSTTAGALTDTPPAGESALLQKLAKVTRSDNSAGSMTVMGAGRTNAVPNLNEGHLFVGNASNQAVSDNTLHVDIANSKVGIGTAIPTYKLHVVGDGLFTDDLNIGIPHANENQSSKLFLNESVSGTYDFITLAATQNNGSEISRIVFKNRYGTSSFSDGQEASYIASERQSSSGIYDLTFGVASANDADATEKMRIDHLGNLGIGTASPASKLHVYGADPVLTIQDSESTVANASAILRIGESDTSANLNNNFALKFAGSASGGDLDISRYNNTSLAAQGVRIKHDGNVGIGTTSADLKLHINNAGGSPNTRFSRGTGYIFDLKIDNIITNSAIDYIIEPNQASSGILFRTHNSSNTNINALAINRDGNVGIGTLNPLQKLHVVGSTLISNNNYHYGYTSGGAQATLVGIKSNNYVTIGQLNANNVGTDIYGGTGNIYLYSGSTNRLTVSSDVNVQGATDLNINGPSRRLSFTSGTGTIRTTTSNNLILQTNSISAITIYPTQQVQFNAYGSGAFTGTATQRLAVDSSGNIIEVPIGSGAVDGSGAANKVTYWTDTDTISYNNNFHWDNTNGNLGIGTDVPNSTLHVYTSANITARFQSTDNKAEIYVYDNDTTAILGAENANIYLGSSTGSAAGFLRIATTTGNATFGAVPEGNTRLKIVPRTVEIASNSANYQKAVYVSGLNFYDINSGVTDSGYRIAVDASVFVSDADFEGTLANQYAIWARHGANVSAAGSTITRSIGVYIDSLTNANTTITNLYGLYQEDSVAKNYFSGSVGIGTTSPAEKFEIQQNGNYQLKLTNGSTGGGNVRIAYADNAFGSGGSKVVFDLDNGGSANAEFVIQSDGNVGIGTTDPRGPLEVYAASDSTLVIERFTSNGIQLRADNSADSAIRLGFEAYTYEFKNGSGASRLHIDANGNVGIGATTVLSTAKLDVRGNIFGQGFNFSKSGSIIGANITLTNLAGDASSNDLTITAAHSTNSIVLRAAQKVEFYTYASGSYNNRLTILNNGNVGIGTTSPGAKLAVQDGQVTIYDSLSTPTYGDGSQERLRVGRGASQSISFQVSDLHNTITAYQDESASETHRFILDRESSTSGIHDFHIARNGSYQVTVDRVGNVGIGTTTPNSRLDVRSTSAFTNGVAYVEQGLATNLPTLLVNQTVSGGNPNVDQGLVVKAVGTSDGSGNTLHVYQRDGSTTGLVVKGSGNVGIGTPTPIAPLNVVSTGVGIQPSLDVTNNQTAAADVGVEIRFSGITNSSLGRIRSAFEDVGSNSYMSFHTRTSGTPTEKMRIDASGLVGIGTTSPGNYFGSGNTLVIANTASSAGITIVSNTANSGNIYFSDGTSGSDRTRGLVGYNHAANYMVFHTDAAEAMRINSSGNVGIGTVAPSQKLHVQGTLRLTGAFYDSNNAAGTSGQVLTSTGSATDWKTLDEISGVTASNPTTTNYVTKWSDGTNEVITDSIIQDNGNIGIGVAPANGYKLKVAGNGYFSGTLTEASSLAIKENIENFTPSIDKINKIRPVKYNKKGSDKKEIGLIAEELEELFPELVEKDENGNPSGVNYSRAVTVLLGGFKELYKELQEIKKRI